MRKCISLKIEELPEDIIWLLEKTDGYLDMQMLDRACDELAQVPEPYWENVLYQEVLLRLTMGQQDWALAADVARTLCIHEPDKPENWVHFAYVIRRHQNIERAHTILRQAIKSFPQEPVIAFNLACYECRMGNPGKARQYLDQACQLNPKYLELALEDDDLEPLWDQLG